jgi:hypothetical protein
MNIRYDHDAMILRQLDAEGGAGNAVADKVTSGGDAPKSDAPAGDAAAKGDPGASGGDKGATGADAALSDLSLTDEMRTKLLGGLPETARDPAAKWLKTRSSMVDLVKAGLGADSKISELNAALKGAIKPLGKDAKPEDVSAYRKAMGVPEAADKYAVYRPDGYEPTDTDTEAEKTYLEAMHAVNAPQAVVDAGLKAHYVLKQQEAKAQEARVAKAAEAAVEDLRVEFGRDYKANIVLADRWLSENLGGDMGDDWKGLMGLRFADGTALGEKPGFVKAIVRLAKAASDDGALIMPTDMGAGMDVDVEIKKMTSKQGTPEYNKPEFQEKLDRLIAIQLKRKAAA